MKKTIYLCNLIFLCMNGWAQIVDSENWRLVLDENFAGNRSWDFGSFKEQSSDVPFQQHWECMLSEHWPYYVTTDENSHQAFQPNNTRFDSVNIMKLQAELISTTPLSCSDEDYLIPNDACCSYQTNDIYYPPHPSIYYYSGALGTSECLGWFGYYEMKCQLPSFEGVHTAFWLYGANENYEEIDIFEHCFNDCSNDIERGCSCGVWFNQNGTNYFGNDLNDGASKVTECKWLLQPGDMLSREHVYGMEWMPDRITWYVDGQVVHEYTDAANIPQHPLKLRVTHPVKTDAYNQGVGNQIVPKWEHSDPVVIHYIHYYRLISDCDTDASIHNSNEWVNLTPGVKHSITIGSSTGINVPTETNKVLMASGSITITSDGGFTIPQGAQATFMIHECIENNDY